MGLLEDNLNWFKYYKNSLQGNILKPHGRKFARLLFFQLDENKKQNTSNFFSEMATAGELISANKQLEQIRVYKETENDKQLFVGLYLTSLGYKYFGKPSPFPLPIDNNSLHSEFDQNHSKKDFLDDQPVHGMLLLAHDYDGHLDVIVDDHYKKRFTSCGAKWIAPEKGNKLNLKRRVKGKDIDFTLDHFGFTDGISEPVFLDRENNTAYDTLANIKNFFVYEPETRKFGSFLVYLKLEQETQKFRTWEAGLQEELRLRGHSDQAENAAALMIGRTRQGTPLADPTKESLEEWNDFKYPKSSGGGCPFHAHIRKMNGRHSGNANEDIKILRRGISFGKQGNLTWDTPHGDEHLNDSKGLHFMSFQNNIEEFDKLLAQAQSSVSNPGIDPLIGFLGNDFIDDETRKNTFNHEFHFENNSFTFNGFGGFVKQTARLEMFAPSLNFFKN